VCSVEMFFAVNRYFFVHIVLIADH
jgi:hypothetical protein